MKHLYFVRHGISEFNKKHLWSGHTDTLLAPEGHKQAQKAGKQAERQGLHFDFIVSSPLARARHTAEYIAEHTGYPPENIVLNDLFKERHYGKLEGKRHNIRTVAPYMVNESSIDKHGGETLAELQARADKALEFLYSLKGDSILVVAHGSFGRALYRAAKNLPLHHRHTRFKNAEIVRFI